MPSDRQYRDAEGKPVPSVTTVIKSSLGGWGTEGLIKWAWQKGMAQIDYAHIRDEAATVGSIAHYLIECFTRNVDPDFTDLPRDLLAQAAVPFESFMKWYTSQDIEFTESELKLTHPRYRYGGTLDAIADIRPPGKLASEIVLLDYKSGKGVYAEVIAQLGAYRELYEADRPYQIDRAQVLHISREGHFAVYNYSAEDLQLGLSLFFNALSQYELKRKAEKIHRREQKRHAQPTPVRDPDEIPA